MLTVIPIQDGLHRATVAGAPRSSAGHTADRVCPLDAAHVALARVNWDRNFNERMLAARRAAKRKAARGKSRARKKERFHAAR